LRSSKQYSRVKAFGMIPREGVYPEPKRTTFADSSDPKFYEAQALVLSNMGQHKQALDIYVFKMKDFEKAEE
jgi:hypothetical protein